MTMANLSAIAYAIRSATAASDVSLKLSHAQQLVAAAFGHRSLASYQAAKEDAAFAKAAHVVIDSEYLRQRGIELAIPLDHHQLSSLIEQAVKARHTKAKVHDSDEAFRDSLESFLEVEVVYDDNVAAKMAMCNHEGVSEVAMPVDITEITEITPIGQTYAGKIKGLVLMEIDTERPYSGHEIRIEANLSIDRLGYRCFGKEMVEITYSQLSDYFDENESPSISLAQAVADFTGLDIETAEAVTQIGFVTNASADGLIYSYIYDCNNQLPQEVETIVRESYPGLKVEIPAWVMENVASL